MSRVYKKWVDGLVLREFDKRFAIGGHCGLCGKWIDNHIVGKNSRVTICDDCSVDETKLRTSARPCRTWHRR